MVEVTTPPEAEVAPSDAAEDPRLAYAALIEEIQKPIAADDPCGEDVRYDDDFQELKTEIDRVGSVATDIDYDRIVELGRAILRDKSKDLTTAGFLALGLVRAHEVEGLAEAVVTLDTLVASFWEHVHPLKPVRRRNALQYAADQMKSWLDQRLEEQRPTEAERAPLELAHARWKALQAFTTKEMDALAPALSSIVKSLEETIRRLPKPKAPEPKPAETTAAGDGQAASAAATSAAAAPAVPAAITSESEANKVFFKAVAFLREQDRANPTPYRLLRALRWGRLAQAPPNENGKTKIPPPVAQRLVYFAGLLEQGEHEKLLDEAEGDFQGTPIFLWLALQRLMAGAAEALGPEYQGVAEALTVETALLLRRLPGLRGLTYSDGTTPFIDAMTEEWLDTKAAALLGAGSEDSAATASAAATGSHLDALYQEARKKLGTGDLGGALAVMQEDGGRDASEEDRFRRRFYSAVLCVRGNKPVVARAMLESLDEDVARYVLDSWNPVLTLEVWSNLYTCYITLSKTARPADKTAFAEQATEVLDKISRLDAGFALAMLSQK